MAAAQPTEPSSANGKVSSPKASKMHRRSRSGCFTCRLRRKKCSEEKPRCKACKNLGLECEYKRPVWWSNNETRRKQKDHIKNIIKRTKTSEKASLQDNAKIPPHLRHAMPPPDTFPEGYGHLKRSNSEDSDDDYDEDIIDPAFAGTPAFYDPQAQQYYNIPFSRTELQQQGIYEVDIRTDRQTYVNEVPTRHDSSISTFNTFIPPPNSVLPSFTGDEFLHQGHFETPTDDWNGQEGLDFNFFDFSSGAHIAQPNHTAQIEVDDSDQPLLSHFINSVLPMVFPILDHNPQSFVKEDVITAALESNQTYLHCCLSTAAMHMKSAGLAMPETIDGDIVRHKYAFVQKLVGDLGADLNHLQCLEATLGMISLSCITDQADVIEMDIPWHQHFQVASDMVRKLELLPMLQSLTPQDPTARPDFNMSLTAWIDILGATMLGRAPFFADMYRNRHITAGSSGLAELMGCQDNVMYLLSEVACLDSLRLEKKLDDMGVCSHVRSLGQQMDATESPTEVVQYPFSSSGTIRPRQLSRNITAIFRKAVRIYLCTLVPGYDRYSQVVVNLVQQCTDILQYIPNGPEGFDRCIIWPLLIAGSCSTPGSLFRKALAERADRMGVVAQHGNFGRLMRLLNELWRRNDDLVLSATVCEATPVTAGAISPLGNSNSSPLPPLNTNVGHGAIQQRPQEIHWRELMRENCWDFLLM